MDAATQTRLPTFSEARAGRFCQQCEEPGGGLTGGRHAHLPGLIRLWLCAACSVGHSSDRFVFLRLVCQDGERVT